MSELIHMRQRIKAVGTIKKVTHAMRLISMATHAKLRTQRDHFEEYQKELIHIFRTLQKDHTTHYSLTNPQANRHLAIVVGSQKGLVGNFNNAVVGFFARQFEHIDPTLIDVIVIGKKAIELLADKKSRTILEFNVFNQNTLPAIAQKILNYLLAHENQYQSIIMCAQYPKTFFIQRPTAYPITELMGFADEPGLKNHEEYRNEYSPQEISSLLWHQLIQKRIHLIMLNSLVAEQAARFIAMDGSTRNASTMLDDLRIDYNKLRQAKITRELTDLVGSFFK